MDAKDVMAVLREQYAPPEWLFFDELRVGTGFGRKGVRSKRSVRQRMDGWAINTWPSRRYERVAFEVKVSRQDYALELRNPEKRQWALSLSNRFYFVAPLGVCGLAGLPEEAGLMIVNSLGICRVVKEAPWRGIERPPLAFVASLLRRSEAGERDDSLADSV